MHIIYIGAVTRMNYLPFAAKAWLASNNYSCDGWQWLIKRAKSCSTYIGGRSLVSQIIEPVTFARCAFIIALRNIALDGYLDTHRNI